MPRYYKLWQREGVLPAGKIHQVAQQRGLGMTFGKTERGFYGAVETITARQGGMVGNLLHAEIDRARRLHRMA